MAERKRSAVWTMFIAEDKETATCDVCRKVIRHCGNTTNLHKHIKSVHPRENSKLPKKPKLERNVTTMDESAALSKHVPSSSATASPTEYAAVATPQQRTKEMTVDEKLARELHKHKMKYLKEEHEMKMRILQLELDMKLEERAMLRKRYSNETIVIASHDEQYM